jgi:hypothetical protein
MCARSDCASRASPLSTFATIGQNVRPQTSNPSYRAIILFCDIGGRLGRLLDQSLTVSEGIVESSLIAVV